MAKKEREVPEEATEMTCEDQGFVDEETDFDVEEEYKPTPLVPKSTYHAFITEVSDNKEAASIDFTCTFQDNGGIMSDGETQIDGSTIKKRVFLPKPGDDQERTKSGKMTKRQAKINMMRDFAEGMKINMNNLSVIRTAIDNSEWIGLSVTLKVDIREYQGRFSNDIVTMVMA